MSKVNLLAVVLAVLAGSAAAQYASVAFFSASTCTGTALTTTYYKSGVCSRKAGAGSSMLTYNSTAAWLQTFSDNACATLTGTAVATVSATQCVSAQQFTWPISGSFIEQTLYSDTSCATINYGPLWFQSGVCIANTVEYKAGSTLTICSGCTSTSDGTCVNSGAKSGDCYAAGGSGAAKYTFSAASTVAPSIALAVACVAAVLSALRV